MRNGARPLARQTLLSLLLGTIPLGAFADTQFATVFDFAPDPAAGVGPRGGLILATDGRFYGRRQNPQEVFRVNVNGSSFSSVHTFPMGEGGSGGVMEASDGKIYGSAFDASGGYLYRMDKNGSNYQKIVQFSSALAGIDPTSPPFEASDGFLYGPLTDGTITGHGGFYKSSKDGTSVSTLLALTGTAGGNPGAYDGSIGGSLIQVGGELFGVTPLGGANDAGVIFKITLTPSVGYTAIHEFTVSEGASAKVALLHASDGRLYGVAQSGGNGGVITGFGTIFGINTDGTGFQVLHRFNDINGNDPSGSLIEAPDGKLYGLCFRGGAPGDNFGVAYRINKNGTGHSVIHKFRNDTDAGFQPEGALVRIGPSSFYGGTTFGPGDGTIYRIDTTQSSPAVFGKKKKRIPSIRRKVTVRGRATDDLDVASVFYRVRGKGGTRIAKGSGERWRIRLKPKRRRTVIKAFAIDFDLNNSPQRKFIVIKR
ncbi:MAG: hypothetical protein CMO55_10250 [Verrucomicrobiales bacterium]|nr:hypothetical protein [Verrucomicrobiales bacterium]